MWPNPQDTADMVTATEKNPSCETLSFVQCESFTVKSVVVKHFKIGTRAFANRSNNCGKIN